ncbi:hypothetical protein AAFF_G00393200 [Aldrovandia affinis]|uniref:Disks large-associated protein 4-like n=1 Tax=Aldrovandia affinis TaxID=143900 RepID=A0AAD7SFN2_9TELE|nr:hypothetical protein AAFF_G00393200 [Aldrovandia affinis]
MLVQQYVRSGTAGKERPLISSQIEPKRPASGTAAASLPPGSRGGGDRCFRGTILGAGFSFKCESRVKRDASSKEQQQCGRRAWTDEKENLTGTELLALTGQLQSHPSQRVFQAGARVADEGTTDSHPAGSLQGIRIYRSHRQGPASCWSLLGPSRAVVSPRPGPCSKGDSLATMKGLGANRSRHLSESCDPSSGHPEPLYPQPPIPPRSPYLLSPTMDHYGTMDPHHFPSSAPDCMLPLNNQLAPSPPRLGPEGDSIGGISTGTLGTSMSMGMGLGRGAMITSGSATISAGSRMQRLPPNLLDQFEKQLPANRDGFSTLQFHRSAASKQRADSPGRIRYLVHSVQKLFAKSQSLESSVKGNVNGRFANSGGGGGSSAAEDGKQGRRSKSKDRAKTEGAKRRPRSNMSGYWSSDDLDGDISNYRNPAAMMALGRQVPDVQDPSKYYPQGYNTISEHTLKASKSNSDMEYRACQALASQGVGGGGGDTAHFLKGGSWSTLTLSQARQVCQKGSATIDRSLLKSKSCHQDLACHYLQVRGRVPPGDWNSTLGRGAGSSEIPCRRMRSGSYVKAMGDLEDSEDSEGSPKPSPKSAARRQSYLKATQQSLSEQLPPRKSHYAMLQGDMEALWSPLQSVTSLHQLGSCLPSLRELSNNRSLDNLDCIGGPVSSSFPRWDDEDFSQGCNTLGKISCMSQLREMEASQRYEETCAESVFCESDSQGPEPLDLPLPTCFRSRSHSYLRAIQAGCSQDDDTASMDSDSPPPTATTVRTYSTSTRPKSEDRSHKYALSVTDVFEPDHWRLGLARGQRALPALAPLGDVLPLVRGHAPECHELPVLLKGATVQRAEAVSKIARDDTHRAA